MTGDVEQIMSKVVGRLAAAANPQKAGPMAAYMKTTMPFYGVQNPKRVEITRDLAPDLAELNRTEYRRLVKGLWALSHREEKYMAIAIARHCRRHIVRPMLPMYRSMIIQGGWWDFVDEMAINLVGKVLLDDRVAMAETMDEWIDDQDLWIRRTAIISQIKHKDATDEARLFRYCAERAHETDFFIRKAIGWSLREYGKTNPDAVRAFVASQGDALSGLSRREAIKRL